MIDSDTRACRLDDTDRGADVGIELSTPTDAALAVKITIDVDTVDADRSSSGQMIAELKVDDAGNASVGRVVARKGFGKGRRQEGTS